MTNPSLGMVETLGWTAAVEAADAGTKAANVRLLPYGRAGAGLIMVKFEGDVAAVQAAVAAASVAAGKVGEVVSVHVIPRPDTQLEPVLGGPAPPPSVVLEQEREAEAGGGQGDRPTGAQTAPPAAEEGEKTRSAPPAVKEEKDEAPKKKRTKKKS